MQVTLTPQGEQLLREALAQHPGESPAQILEQALAQHVAYRPGTQSRVTRAEFHAWLDQFTAYSDKIPLLPDEAFSRQSLYQDHD